MPDGAAAQAVVFPSHHGGFMGGEFGYAGQPEAFARKLRDVIVAAPAIVSSARRVARIKRGDPPTSTPTNPILPIHTMAAVASSPAPAPRSPGSTTTPST